MPPDTLRARLQRLAAQRRVFRGRDALAAGVPWAYLGRAVREGTLIRLARGLYAHPDHVPAEHGTLVEVAARVPHGVICLLSAMRFHGLTTQNPHDVWILLDRRARSPAFDAPRLHVVRASGRALTAGIDEHEIDGATVRITNVAKTVCDGFRYRSHIGLDVAIEALRDALTKRLASPSEIAEMAQVVRVRTVIQPYLESLA
ncbi:MAG: transcriptional regulator [bacterium]|nr:transcriptional regulator [bacterium]